MGTEGATDVVDSVWDQQSVWSQTADLLRARIDRLRSVMLGLGVASAVATTLAAQVATLSSVGGKALALAAGVSLGLVPVVRARLGRDAVSRWTRARSVSEALKAEVYPFLAGVAPFRGVDRGSVLITRVHRVQADAADLFVHTAGVGPLSREVPAVHDVASYVRTRLAPQIAWYQHKARLLARRLAWAQRIEFTLSVVGVVLAAVAATWAVTAAAAWVAVVTTVTAAVSSHVAAARWEYQLVEYLRTAGELVRLREGWAGAESQDEAIADRLVERCEHVVSAQNDAWMAKWAADDR